MMNFKTSYRFSLIIALTVLGVSSCKHEFPEVPEETVGSLDGVDLSKTVFIGSTLFSGINNGALTNSNASFSIPEILLNHLADSEETQSFSPSVDSENGFNVYENNQLTGSNGQYQLFLPSFDTTAFDRRITSGSAFQYINTGSQISNYSFPKAQILDFTESNRNVNGFIPTFFSTTNSSLTTSIVADAPSFFMMNMGYEDLLGYAINGGEGASGETNINNHEYADILSPQIFEQKLQAMTDALLGASSEARGALLNIPDFLKFPFFIKVGYDVTPYIIKNLDLVINVKNQSINFNQQLNEFYNNNPGIPFSQRRPTLDFSNDIVFQWGILVEDERLNQIVSNGNVIPKVRHLDKDELAFFPNESFLDSSRGIFPTNALTENQYLRIDEIQEVKNQISAYNQAIENVVASSNGKLVLIDIAAYFDELFQGFNRFLNQPADGTIVEGVSFLPTIEELGIFSADGLNLNARGSALLANELITLLNTVFNGTLKGINPNNFHGTDIVIGDNN